MTRKLDRSQIAQIATVVAPTSAATAVVHPPRTFELPFELYGATVGFYLGFLALLGTVLANPELILPIAICMISVAAGFIVPSRWARTAPETRGRSLTWGQFRARGIQTHTGPIDARNATIQVLILPALIFCWGLIVTAIVFTV